MFTLTFLSFALIELLSARDCTVSQNLFSEIHGPVKPSCISEDQVNAWVRKWQHILQLTDWEIEAHIVYAQDLKPDTLGNLKWNGAQKFARMKILRPIGYPVPSRESLEEMECTVVHELVHLQLSTLPFARYESNKKVEEGVVNKITDALLHLDKTSSFMARNSKEISVRGNAETDRMLPRP